MSGSGEELKLNPSLGLLDATAISVGATIGAGIFVVTGLVAGLAGPAMILSMIIAAVTALFTALSIMELSKWLPREGSVYVFAYRLLSPFAGFMVGWMWIISNTFTGAAVSLGFAYYFTSLFPVAHPKVVAALLCLAFTGLNYLGVRQSAYLNDILVASKLLILAFFIAIGLAYVNPSHFKPFVTSELGVIYGASYVFFAYGGFARVTLLAEEVKDPKHTLPRAILLSLAVSTAFYLLIGAVAVGMVGAPALSASLSPLASAMSVTGINASVYLISLGGLLSTASVLLTSILGVSREAYAMARRNALPKALCKLHPRYDTPYLSIWMSGTAMALMALSMDLNRVVAISAFGQLFYYALADISDLRLRLQRRGEKILVPVVGTSSCLILLAFLLLVSPMDWVLGLIGIAAGIIYYIFRVKGIDAKPV